MFPRISRCFQSTLPYLIYSSNYRVKSLDGPWPRSLNQGLPEYGPWAKHGVWAPLFQDCSFKMVLEGWSFGNPCPKLSAADPISGDDNLSRQMEGLPCVGNIASFHTTSSHSMWIKENPGAHLRAPQWEQEISEMPCSEISHGLAAEKRAVAMFACMILTCQEITVRKAGSAEAMQTLTLQAQVFIVSVPGAATSKSFLLHTHCLPACLLLNC